jgi:hypothetical protein
MVKIIAGLLIGLLVSLAILKIVLESGEIE